ncbi:copper chaperone PCu(A)C [Microbulbifer sp. HZ11]|uniref:copper chaperone PCu(A)C n=1 Tax=unclassified Microbulbifer TaxID=2619833 RepID=UPI0006901DC1|nr:copper chaperone PCu(A)C [Microbulbifer sp. HZ11]
MIKLHVLFALCITACLPLAVTADEPAPDPEAGKRVDALGYAREMPSGAPVGAAYLQLRNPANAARVLKRIEAPAHPAAKIELHTTQQVDGVSRMRPVEKLAVPAQGVLEMGPGATHLMVHGVRLKAGDTLALRLVFADGGIQQLELPVLGLTESPPAGMRAGKPQDAHHHHHHHGHG